MYKIVNKTRAVQGVILTLAFLAMVTIYPIRMWQEIIPSVSNQIVAGSTDNMRSNYLLQRFIAQYDHLDTINVYVADFKNGWDRDKKIMDFNFKLYDSDMQLLFEQDVDTRFSSIPGFCPVYVNEELVVGKDYYYFLQGNENDIWFGLEETAGAGTPYVSRLVENYDEIEGYNIIAEYNYSAPLRKQKVLLYDALLLLLAAVLALAVEWYGRKRWKNQFITVEKTLRCTANPLIAAGTLGAMLAVWPMELFSHQTADILFYEAGIALLAAVLFYGVNHRRDRSAYVPLWGRFRKNLPDLLQSVFIAGAIWGCCNYMNGLYDIHHTIAERQVMLFLALAVLATYRRKELLNVVNIIYAVLAVAGGLIYYYANFSFVKDGEMGITALKLLIWVAGLAGLVVINTLRIVIKKQIRQLSPLYGGILGLFFVLAVVFRNTRWWPVAMAVAFTLYYLRFSAWDKKGNLLNNISNGIILHFILAVIFALQHRPFVSWIYPRYPFIFHTVTITAVYLSVVLCAALVKLTDRYHQSHKLSDIWKELCLFGAAMSYLLFTASRTGIMAAVAMFAVVVVMTAAGRGFCRIKAMAAMAGLMLASTVIAFPVTFSAQRMIPAVCEDTYTYEIETYPDAITRGNEWDSMYYITLERFKEVFANKLFGVPERGSDSHERTVAYQEELARRFDKDGNVIDPSAGDAEVPQGAAGAGASGDAREITIIGSHSDASADTAEDAAENPDGGRSPEELVDTPEQATEEYANGRFSIFRSYLSQLNASGHETMGALLEDGTEATHAHNIYLQVAYDHGAPVGVLFILLGVFTLIQSVVYYVRRKDNTACAALPAAIVVSFALAGMVEWIFHLCNPAGFALLLVLAPLLFDMEKKPWREA